MKITPLIVAALWTGRLVALHPWIGEVAAVLVMVALALGTLAAAVRE